MSSDAAPGPAPALHTVADVPTDRAERYARQLVSHLGHKSTMVEADGGHTMHFPAERGIAATGFIGATSDAVRLEVRADDAESLATAQRVIGGHLEKFGARDGLAVHWS